MVNKQAKKVNLVAYHDEFNNYDFVVDVLMNVMGWEHSQAENGAHLIDSNGSYLIRSFKIIDLEKAKAYEQALVENGMPAKLLIS